MLHNIEFEREDFRKIFNSVCDDDLYRNHLLAEYGNVNVKTNIITGEMKYSDWHMEFDKDITLTKKSNSINQNIQFIFCINRNLSWNIVDKNENVYMEKGQVCIYKDDFQNTFCNYPGGKNFIFKNIQISDRYFNNIIDSLTEKNIKHKIEDKMCNGLSKFSISPEIYRILNEIDNADKYKSGIKNIYLEGKILELIAIYLLEIIECEDSKNERKVLKNKEDIEAMKRVKEIIDDSFDDTPTCEELAVKINMSVSKFTKSFAKMYGTSVHKYVINKRLENAAMLLIQKHISISEAAGLSGYNNMSHFSDSFRKKYGVLPKDFCV